MPILRKSAVALAMGFLAGLIVREFHSRQSTLPPATPETSQPPALATVPLPDWQLWLDDSAPLIPTKDAPAFWQNIAEAQKQPRAHRELTRDEGYALLPDTAFTAILSDPRFIALNPENPDVLRTDGRSQWKPLWWLRLWQSGPARAIRAAGTLPSPFFNDSLERHLSDALARTDPDIGLAWIQTLHDPYNPLADYMGKVANHDLKKAQELWSRLPLGGPTKWSQASAAFARRLAASALIRELAQSDWQAAIAWASAHLSRDDTQQTMKDMLTFMGPEKSKEVLAEAAGIKDPAIRSLAYSHTLSEESNGPMESLMDKVLALPENALDKAGWDLLGQRSAGMVPRTADPAAEASRLKTLADRVPEAFRQGFIEHAAMMAGWNNKPLAGQLLEYLPDGNAGLMAGDWLQQDPAAASTWLATLPPSPKRDAAVAGFCRELAPVDPSSAAHWALSMQDAKLKEKALRDAVGAWKQKDPAAAEAWLLEKGGGAAGF